MIQSLSLDSGNQSGNSQIETSQPSSAGLQETVAGNVEDKLSLSKEITLAELVASIRQLSKDVLNLKQGLAKQSEDLQDLKRSLRTELREMVDQRFELNDSRPTILRRKPIRFHSGTVGYSSSGTILGARVYR